MSLLNVPMMALNAGLQMLIPPPKYMITDLVDCEIGDRIPIRHVFLIERGSPSLVAAVGPDDALIELLAKFSLRVKRLQTCFSPRIDFLALGFSLVQQGTDFFKPRHLSAPFDNFRRLVEVTRIGTQKYNVLLSLWE